MAFTMEFRSMYPEIFIKFFQPCRYYFLLPFIFPAAYRNRKKIIIPAIIRLWIEAKNPIKKWSLYNTKVIRHTSPISSKKPDSLPNPGRRSNFTFLEIIYNTSTMEMNGRKYKTKLRSRIFRRMKNIE